MLLRSCTLARRLERQRLRLQRVTRSLYTSSGGALRPASGPSFGAWRMGALGSGGEEDDLVGDPHGPDPMDAGGSGFGWLHGGGLGGGGGGGNRHLAPGQVAHTPVAGGGSRAAARLPWEPLGRAGESRWAVGGCVGLCRLWQGCLSVRGGRVSVGGRCRVRATAQ